MAQRKETKKKVKVRDLKPKKDATGGRFYLVATPSGRSLWRPGHRQAVNQANLHI